MKSFHRFLFPSDCSMFMIVFRLPILLSVSLLKAYLFPPCAKTASLLFHLLSFRSSTTSCGSCRLFQMWSRCLLNCFGVLNVWDSLQTWPSYLLTPPPPSALACLSFLLYRRQSERWEVAFLWSSACPPHVIVSLLCLSHPLPLLSLLYLFHSYGTMPSSILHPFQA